MILHMMWLPLVGVSAAADFASLDTTSWREAGTRETDVGEIAIRASYVDAVGCVEGTTTVSVSASALLAVTDDMASAPSWSSAELTVSEEVERHGSGFVILQRLDVPGWTLAADRYWAIHGQASTLEHGIGRYRWQRVDASRYPLAEEVGARAIEPPVNYGEWVFTPTGLGTELRYRACADFGGRVPAPIQRWINTQQVPALVRDLVQEARRRSEG